jgi:hypothetical protein
MWINPWVLTMSNIGTLETCKISSTNDRENEINGVDGVSACLAWMGIVGSIMACVGVDHGRGPIFFQYFKSFHHHLEACKKKRRQES